MLRVNRPEVAEATLDYYHASQHLGVLADFLFAHEKDASAKEKWLDTRRHELRHKGAKSPMGRLRPVNTEHDGGTKARRFD